MSEAPQPDPDSSLWMDMPASPGKLIRHSLILAGFQLLIRLLWYLSVIEYWKILVMSFAAPGPARRRARSLAIDIYMILIWVVLAALILGETHTLWARFLVSYLIASSLVSFFYYHVWKPEPPRRSYRSQLRRTAGFVLSFSFGVFGYAYLFSAGHADAIEWPNGNDFAFSDALLLSLSTAFTSSFGAFELKSEAVRWVAAGEMLFVFGFVAIIVVNSLPSR